MKIVVLSGSPKGETSVTMQYVRYIEKQFPQHEMSVVHVAQRIKKLERDPEAFRQVIDQVRDSDGVLWAFPLYILHVHANYKRFIELIWERDAEDAFAGRYAATLSTSIHFYDHTAHNYMHAICDDLNMRYTSAFSPEMRDLLSQEGRVMTQHFARSFFQAIEEQTPGYKTYQPAVRRDFGYVPGDSPDTVKRIQHEGQRIVLLTDALPGEKNLRAMIHRFASIHDGPIEMINLRELEIKGSCIGCLRCGYNNECTYEGKDDYIDMFTKKLVPADILVFAGNIHDRYLSSTWKTFFDRSFFNTHTPALIGKQFGFLVTGPLSQNANLREILLSWVEFQQSHVVGFVSDEFGDSPEIDDRIHNLAAQLVQCVVSNFVPPATFRGVGGLKVFRDDIWGRLRTVFQADHRAYKRLGIYDFPQRQLGIRLLNALTGILFKVPRVREAFASRMKENMIQPYARVLES